MGFSVTASHVIFFVAILSAGSVAMSAFWKTEAAVENGREAEGKRLASIVHTNLSIANVVCAPVSCIGGANATVTFNLWNSGDTTLDVTKLTHVVQGQWTNKAILVGVTAPSGSVGATDLLMPGEYATITLYQVSFNGGGTVDLKVITDSGVAATYRR